jgi:hypothetical protein
MSDKGYNPLPGDGGRLNLKALICTVMKTIQNILKILEYMSVLMRLFREVYLIPVYELYFASCKNRFLWIRESV